MRALTSRPTDVRFDPEGSSPTPRDREGDPALLALVEEPYTGVEETEERLRELLSAFEARGDDRADFLAIYARMTRAVARRIRRGGFADAEWTGDYLVAFANLYREAVYDYEAGNLDALADPWQLAFEAAEDDETPAIENAILGVNAHVNYDLALALDEVGIEKDRETKYEDHSTVTEVIGSLVGEVWDSLTTREEGVSTAADRSLGRLDEGLVVVAIDECRDSAWRTARALNSRFRPRRRLARRVNDTAAAAVAHLVANAAAGEPLRNGTT